MKKVDGQVVASEYASVTTTSAFSRSGKKITPVINKKKCKLGSPQIGSDSSH